MATYCPIGAGETCVTTLLRAINVEMDSEGQGAFS